MTRTFFRWLALVSFAIGGFTSSLGAVFNVRDFGAKGDGVALDSPAINAAIEAAAAAGGGTVVLSAGRYLSFSIRLKSNLTLELQSGAVLVAADPASGLGRYDAAEKNPHDEFQDFGHSHWQNSLLWGDGLVNVAIVGHGLIDGTNGLVRHGPPAKRDIPAANASVPASASAAQASAPAPPPRRNMEGAGNKAIALKNCRNVTLRDFSVLNAGHFALLATGVDHLTIDNLKVDTNRDGFDIDACRNVRVSNCSVNTPHDDAIVLKSSHGLGFARDTENVTIANCHVSGFDVGTMLDGTFQRTLTRAPDRDGPTGRIKFGTESNGGFKNIVISNCVFTRSRGLALETVDGGVIEDVAITNITMREVTNAPIFLRLGNRARGPAGTAVGAIRRVKISHITVHEADGRFPVILAGLPGHPIEDVTLSDIHVNSRGGITLAQVAAQPVELVNEFFLRGDEAGVKGPRDPFAVPQRETAYPEPSMFGLLPASAVFARHVRGLEVRDVSIGFAQSDERPLVVLDDVRGVKFDGFEATRPTTGPAFVLRAVERFSLRESTAFADASHERTERVEF